MKKIRQLLEKDLEIVRVWRNSPDINRFLFNRHEISVSEHLNWYKETQLKSSKKLFVFEDGDQIKGFLQLEKINDDAKVFEWGFYVGSEFQRKGVGMKFAKEILSYVFERLNADKIFGQIIALNSPSIRLHEKLGFVEEGRLRQQCFFEGGYQDVLFFGLLRSEWLQYESLK